MLLVFCIGLAIFDQRASQCAGSGSPQSRSQAKLHGALASAIREMRDIDDTLNRDEWIAMGRHLAIRRLIWEEQAAGNNKSTHFVVFRASDVPTFPDYVKAANCDAVEQLSLVQSALLNNPDISRLRLGLDEASADISDVVKMVRQLNQYSGRHYPLDEAQLKKLENTFQFLSPT